MAAVSSAQQAAHWAKIEQDGDHRYDLRYRTAEDDRVRQSHATLHGIVLPPSDPFWNHYFPPNGWRCRCKAIQVLKGKYEHSDSAQAIAAGEQATTKIGKDGKNPLAIFRFNPGKQHVIFPPDHPYKPKGEVGNQVAEIIAAGNPAASGGERTADYEKYKADKNYTDVQLNEAGGLKATHVLHNFDKNDGRFEKEARDILFDKGNKIILEKELPAKGEKIIDGVRYVDGFLNNDSFEQATILGQGKNSIKHALHHAESKKAKVALLYFPDISLFSEERLHTGIAAFKGTSKYKFEKIVLIVGDKVYEHK